MERDGKLVILSDDIGQSYWNKVWPAGCVCLDPSELSAFLANPDCPKVAAVVVRIDAVAAQRTPACITSLLKLRSHTRLDAPIIFASFERRADLLSLRRPCTEVFDFLLGREFWAHAYLRLPASRGEMAAAVAQTIAAFKAGLAEPRRPGAPRKLPLLRLQSLQLAVELENARFRHSQGTFCAAVRLLLGAAQAQALSDRQTRHLLGLIQERLGGERAPYDFGVLRDYLQVMAGMRQTEGKRGPVAAGVQKHRLFMIDDEWKSAGWDIVLPGLLPAWDVSGSDAVTDGALTKAGKSHLVLLDFRLSRSQSGLAILRQLREKYPLLPVLLFTGDDSSTVYSAALAEGATGVFLKELSDASNRDSLSYFRAFRETLAEFSQAAPENLDRVARTWQILRRMRSGQSDLPLPATRAVALDEAASAVERAVFFLVNAVGMTGFRAAPGNDELPRLILICLGRALSRIESAHDCPSPSTELSGRLRNLFDSNQWCGGSTRSAVLSLSRATAKGRHFDSPVPGWSANTATRLSTACLQVAEIVECCSIAWSIELPRRVLPARGALQPVAVQRDQRFQTHGTRSQLACVRMMLGYGIATKQLDIETVGASWPNSEEIRKLREQVTDVAALFPARDPDTAGNMRLLLIDDTAHTDGWLGALRICLPECDVIHVLYVPALNDHIMTLARNADCVLLDLRLAPEANPDRPEGAGLDLLTRLQKQEPSVRVVTFSASIDLMIARRCYRSGAAYYFTKSASTIEYGEALPPESFFLDYYLEFRDAIESQDIPTTPGYAPTPARVCREQRFRGLESVAARAILAELLEPQSDETLGRALVRAVRSAGHLGEAVAGIERDPVARTIWQYIDSSNPPETAVFEPLVGTMAAMQLVLRTLAIVEALPGCGRTYLSATMKELLVYLDRRPIAYCWQSAFTRELAELNTYRNRMMHQTRKTAADYAHGTAVLAHLLDAATTELAIATAESVRTGARAATSARFGRKLTARNLLDPGKERSKIDGQIALLRTEPWNRLSATLKELSLRQDFLSARLIRDKVKGEDLVALRDDRAKKLVRLEQHRDSGQLTRENFKMVEEACVRASDALVEVQEDLGRAEAEWAEAKKELENIEALRSDALTAYRREVDTAFEMEAALVAQREKLQTIEDWCREREIEELTATALGDAAKPCAWDPHSAALENLLGSSFSEPRRKVEIAGAGTLASQWVRQATT